MKDDNTISNKYGLSLRALFFWMTLYAVAFAWIESAVVHYLHLHFYPDGFQFPLVLWPVDLVMVEFGREISTVIVLSTASFLAASTVWSRFAWFMYIFGIWDILYYIWLVFFEGWPSSPFTMDLLFMVPVPWAGPVLAPILVSTGLVISGILIIKIEANGKLFKPGFWISFSTISGWVIILISFMWDAASLIESGSVSAFRWDLFTTGMLIWVIGVVMLTVKAITEKRPEVERKQS